MPSNLIPVAAWSCHFGCLGVSIRPGWSRGHGGVDFPSFTEAFGAVAAPWLAAVRRARRRGSAAVEPGASQSSSPITATTSLGMICGESTGTSTVGSTGSSSSFTRRNASFQSPFFLDASESMSFGQVSNFDFARQVTAAVGYVALCGFDRVTVEPFPLGDDQVSLAGELRQVRGRKSSIRFFLKPGQAQGRRKADLNQALPGVAR
ncbi:MAG: hypothetical protein Ct9H300mP32_5130 [Verrucomicrobiota bacterium]|nr:MAG: hypothetical protein Ct9H300mP32_5130 [Verrucomicrobiota bacterium]